MFLSKLKIIGFKSFPDKTILDFTNGITSIVGPNGCGKTNIVDAIRWVLGEQKASILRSNKMQEVIFNGTQKKKPLGFCEATLTIENNKNLLPIEYDMVEITRRYYRSGDSEYYINKTQCRLKDIQDMFIDTGMSSGAYSVIELKMIESILSQNPTDRRSMIDEASGINNYNKQKNTSTRRLIATKSDMDRIFDIMNEVETNVKKLKLQMKRFERHKVLSNQLNAADYMFHKKNIDDLNARIDPLKVSLESKAKSKKTLDKNLKGIELDLEKIQIKFEKTRLEMDEIQQQTKDLEELIIKSNQEIIISSEQIGNSKSRINHFNNEVIVKKDQIKSIDLDINDMNKFIKKIMPEFTKRKSEYDKILSNNIKLERDLSELNNELEKNKSRYNEVSIKSNTDSNMIDSNNRLIAEKNNLINSFKKDMQLNLKIHNEADEKAKDLLKELKISNKSKEKYELILSDIDKENNKIQDLLRIENQKSEDLKNNLKNLSNRIDFYNKVIISKDGLSNGNKFLSDNISKYNGVLGKVSDAISAPNNLMRAISVALGEYSDYIIIDKLRNAMNIINQLKKKEMSFNIIALDQIKKNKTSYSKSHLISKIKYDKKFSNLFSLLLGGFVLSDSFESNKSDSCITLSGDMVSQLGLMKINPSTRDSKMSVQLEIDNLKKKIRNIEKVLIAKNKKQIIKLQENEMKLKVKNEKIVIEKATLLTIINDLKIDIEQKKFIASENYNQTRSFQVSISKLEREIVDLGLKNKGLDVSLKTNSKLINDINKKKEVLSKNIQKIETELLSIRQKNQEKNIGLIEISNKRDSLLSRISDQEENRKKIKSDMIRYQDEIEKLNDSIKKLKLSKNKYQSNLKQLHKNEINIKKNKSILETKYSSQYEQFQSYQSEIKDKRVINESNLADINQVTINMEKMKSQKEFYLSTLNQIKIDIVDNEYLNAAEKLSLEELVIMIEKNKKSIENIGPVNMDVGEQHKAEIERYDFLEKQYNDLVESKKSLEETIKKLDTEARKRFEDTFEKIKLNFSKTYNMFYEKGKASLDLKGDDVLDAEIVIKATPPGKSTQSLRMLSGGEKAITAIALLFAIYLVKPSPFCILDEVDAPLDDLNIKRFNNVIKEFSKNSQFIIVTHNKLTMEGSDYLYGVTQAKQGISKIVSVNLKDVEEKILT